MRFEVEMLDLRHALVFKMRGSQAIELTDVSANDDTDDAFWA